MKFTDGYWELRSQYKALYAVQVDDVRIDPAAGTMTVYATTSPIRKRGDTLNLAMLTIEFSSQAEGTVRTKITHHSGRVPRRPDFALKGEDGFRPQVALEGDFGVLTSGILSVRVPRSGPWSVEFLEGERTLTRSLPKSVAAMEDARGGEWIHEQLSVDPGEQVYGLGERFGAFGKMGQVVDIWNEDGGTSSELAYKNVPFYLSSKGYGVLVDTPAKVSFEVGSEVNTRVQFSVGGQSMEYVVFAGPTMADALGRYTAMSGRPPQVPAWSYGLWLSTSFTTDYDEETVSSFIEGMEERGMPLSVFHFDCFWMREFQWVDFQWDSRVFPDPEGMLKRLHDRGLRVCVWINPYVAQRSALFDEAKERGFLVRTSAGDVWQWDKWQAGMGLVDFTNPDAARWYQDKLSVLLDQGVDCFKTDFGERIPTEDVVWFGAEDPERMHNYYPQLYNQTVFELLERRRGKGEAVLFARSATAGGQQFPVHWGGDCDSTFESMAESLRGGLSLGMSGFGYWSHDIGGFEGTPDPAVFKRWVPFGMLSSHSRFHGSGSYRVPWAFDDEAVEVTREFLRLKMRLMPYLMQVAADTTNRGLPMMRPMVLSFPADRNTRNVDTQYMLGDALCVSPVFNDVGEAETYLPEGNWTHLLSGNVEVGGRWVKRQYDYHSLGLFVRPGTVLPVGAKEDGPEYEYAKDVTLVLFDLPDGFDQVVTIPGGLGADASFNVHRSGAQITVSTVDAPGRWSCALAVPGSSPLEAQGKVSADGPGSVTLEVQ